MGDASYRFGPFTDDRIGYQVLRDGKPLDLTPKLLDLLFHLLDHSATLVTKESLLDALWPGANVTENALAQAMSELRDALGLHWLLGLVRLAQDDVDARGAAGIRRWTLPVEPLLAQLNGTQAFTDILGLLAARAR